MEIFDQLVVARWVRSFVLAASAFFLLLTVVTVLAGMTRSSVTMGQVLQNYLYELPKWGKNIVPFACLVATLFCIDQLRNRNELVALYSLGHSPWRAVFSITACAAIIAAVQFYTAAYVAPWATRHRHQWIADTGANFQLQSDFESSNLTTQKTSQSVWVKLPQGYMSFVALTDSGNDLREVEIDYINKDKKLETVVVADSAKFKRDNLWEFHNAKIYRHLADGGFPEYLKKDVTSYALMETPDHLLKAYSDVAALNLPHLGEYIHNIKRTGINAATFEILFWEKYNAGLVCLLFSLIPITGLFSPARRQVKVGHMIVFTVIFGSLYWLSQTGLTSYGERGQFPAWISVFGTSTLFALVLARQFWKFRKL